MKDVKAIFMVALCLIVAFLGLYFQFFSGQSHKDTQENRQENRQEEIQEEKEKKPRRKPFTGEDFAAFAKKNKKKF